MNIETSELQHLLVAINEHNLSIIEAISLIKGNNNSDEQSKPDEEISLTIDYSQSIKQMIEAGKYDWKNGDIKEKHFPFPTELSGKKITVSTKLFHFGRKISTEDAIYEMGKDGYRPATLAELLALGVKHRELQRPFPVIALGSIWRYAVDDRSVPYLNVDGRKRRLSLGWFDGDWDVSYRFLGVCK